MAFSSQKLSTLVGRLSPGSIFADRLVEIERNTSGWYLD